MPGKRKSVPERESIAAWEDGAPYFLHPVGKDDWARVDVEDEKVVALFRWRLFNGYAEASYAENHKRIFFLMHKLIMREHGRRGAEVDHINGDRLDNRRANLRVVSNIENCHNRQGPNRNSTTGIRGVRLYRNGKYAASYTLEGQRQHVGYFHTIEEAHAAVVVARESALHERRRRQLAKGTFI